MTFSPPPAMRARINGLDLARAAAVIGMVAAHVGDGGVRGVYGGDRGWQWTVDGRSAALFAVLAGVTLSVLVRRSVQGRAHASARIAVRAGLLIALGYALAELNTPIDVVLANLGLMMVLALPFLSLRPLALATTGAGWLVIGGAAFPDLAGGLDGVPVLEKLLSYHYPAAVWLGYVLIGAALGSLRLDERASAWRIARMGALATVAGYGGAVALGAHPPWVEGVKPGLLSIEAHSYGPFELIGNAGVAALVISACLLIASRRALLAPALALGSMSLTAYTAHLIAIAVVGEEMVWTPSNVDCAVMIAALMLFAWAWRAWWGQGPLERIVSWLSTRAANAAFGFGAKKRSA